MITIDRLSKDYPTRTGPKHVLRDVSMTLAKGERLGVLGRNGAGKSTLIRLISGAERPSSGTIDRGMSVSWPLAFGGAFQTQLTGVDNVRFISRIYAQDPDHNLAFVEEFAELGQYLREPVRSYSSGMRARLAFAISMIIEFDCFLIDEIASVGDARFHERCNYELFEKRGDRAMMIVSHDAGYIRNHCNRWAVLDDGRMSFHDDFDEAYDHFVERIGVSQPATVPAAADPLSFSRRTAALDALGRVANADEQFRLMVQRADVARDRKDWAKAEQFYAEALSLHPYERSYWAQLGNVLREQGEMVRAEIAYRTAAAFGESARELAPFIATVAQQGDGPAPVPLASPDDGETRQQPPGYPDLALLAALAHGVGRVEDDRALALLRAGISIEEALSRMLAEADPARASVALPARLAMVPRAGLARANWHEDLVRLTGVHPDRLGRAAAGRGDPIAAIREAGGLAGWNLANENNSRKVQA